MKLYSCVTHANVLLIYCNIINQKEILIQPILMAIDLFLFFYYIINAINKKTKTVAQKYLI